MAFSVSQIATAIGARFEGDGSVEVVGPSEPRLASAQSLALAMSPDYERDLTAGSALAAILWDGADWRSLGLKAAIFVPRPRYAMAGVTQHFDVPRDLDAGIHPSAIVDQSAKLGEGTVVGPFAVIGREVTVGENSRIHGQVTVEEGAQIGSNALLLSGVRIGRRVKIGDDFSAHPNAVIGADGFSYVTPQAGAIEEVRASGALSEGHSAQEYVRIHSLGSVRIGDRVEVGALAAIDRGTISDTQVGDGTKIDNLVMIGHNVSVGQNCLLCSQVGVAGSAVIRNRVVLGGQVGVADHVTVGENVVAAGKSGISSNVPPNRVIMGNPAIKMEANVESYKVYRRLPRLAAKLDELQKLVSNFAPKS